MPHGKAKPKPITVEHWSLVKPADLLDLLTAMLGHGYSGAISAHINPAPPGEDGKPGEPEVVWGIQLRSELQPQFSADLGQVVLWDGHELQVISADEFEQRYTA